MWYPVSLKIVNLFSHEDSFFEFVNNQTTTVSGSNKTDSNVKSNGSGKTSILDCIAIGIIGEPLRDINKKEIVRNGEKFGELTFILKNNILSKELKIVREINATKSSNALLYEDGILNDRLKDLEVAETNKYLIKVLGISKEDLKNYFLICKDSYQSFFLSGDTAKKEIINRFSKANIIDNVDPIIEGDVVLLDDTLTELKTQFASNEGLLTHLDEEITKEKLESNIESTRQLTLKSLNERKDAAQKSLNEVPEQIKKKETEILIAEETVAKINDELLELGVAKNKDENIITEHEKEIKEIQKKENTLEEEYKPKFEEIKKKKADCEQEVKDYNASIQETNIEIGEINGILAGTIKCPKCTHAFILKDEKYDIGAATAKKKELENFIEEVKELIVASEAEIVIHDTSVTLLKVEREEKSLGFTNEKEKVKKAIEKVNITLNKTKEDSKAQNKLLDVADPKLAGLNRELTTLKGQTKFYQDQITECDKAIKAENEKEYPDQTKAMQEKKSNLEIANKKLAIEITEWETDKNNLLEWQTRFKQFKSFLANTSISAIQSMTNFFLEKMKTNLTVSIEGYRELTNKKLKEEITTLVCRDGLNGESFSKFSGGEKAKIDLACILSMQKIINIAAEGGGLNLLFIDEILESVDSLSLTGVVKALSELEQTILLITHVEQNSFSCNKLQVEKVNGISKVVSLS